MKGFDWIFFAIMTPPLILALVGIARAGVFRLKLPADAARPSSPPSSQPFSSR